MRRQKARIITCCNLLTALVAVSTIIIILTADHTPPLPTEISDDSRRLSVFNVASEFGDPKSIVNKIHEDGRVYDSDAVHNKAIKIYTYTDLINNAAPLPQYSLSSVIHASNIYNSRFALLRYDPSKDRFIAYYSNRHRWVSGCKKLVEAVRSLTILLRNLFPQRFTNGSPELVLAISGGDYPAIDNEVFGACVRKDEGPCDESLFQQAPILHFGSVFTQPLFPNIIGMPMPRAHTDCFVKWLMRNREPCELFLPTPDALPWDELIPQLVWRGTDFQFLSFQNSLERPSFEKYVDGKTNPKADQKLAATQILRRNFDKLIPRWKGVVYTAESEIEARRTKTLPKINIKFAKVAEGGAHPAIGAKEYKKWDEIGFPVAGESMDEAQLSKFKYHIDLGGGGGTTWTGTSRKLAMPGLLFHHCTPTKDYIHDHIHPWVHYVPVRTDLADIMEKLEWAEKNPLEAKKIAETATELMKQLSTSEGFEPLFEQHVLNPLLEAIEAYNPLDLRDEKSWDDAFEQLGGKQVFSPFMECTTDEGCRVDNHQIEMYKKGSKG